MPCVHWLLPFFLSIFSLLFRTLAKLQEVPPRAGDEPWQTVRLPERAALQPFRVQQRRRPDDPDKREGSRDWSAEGPQSQWRLPDQQAVWLQRSVARTMLGTVRPRSMLGTVGPRGMLGSVRPRGMLGAVRPRGMLGTVRPRGMLGTAWPNSVKVKVRHPEVKSLPLSPTENLGPVPQNSA